MIPFGITFQACGLRINEYGPKMLALLVGEPPVPWRHLLAFMQHMVISWLAAVPLLVLLSRAGSRSRALVGALYGAAFYVGVNAVFLPLMFRDPTPWSLGLSIVYPSLVVHLVFGITVALTARLKKEGERA